MAAIHWKSDFEKLESYLLLPDSLPIELLLSVARSMAMYKAGALGRVEMKDVWDLLEIWITRLLDAKDEELRKLFVKHKKQLLPQLADELDLWIRMELVSRQIGYPAYELTLATLFQTQFNMEAA